MLTNKDKKKISSLFLRRRLSVSVRRKVTTSVVHLSHVTWFMSQQTEVSRGQATKCCITLSIPSLVLAPWHAL